MISLPLVLVLLVLVGVLCLLSFDSFMRGLGSALIILGLVLLALVALVRAL